MSASPEFQYKIYQGKLTGKDYNDRRTWLKENDIGCWIEGADDKIPYIPLSTYWCFETEQLAILFRLRWP